MVRAGVSLYGLYPSDEVDKSRIDLTPVMTLKARIAHLKKVPTGFPVSYGMTHTTPSPTTIATGKAESTSDASLCARAGLAASDRAKAPARQSDLKGKFLNNVM